MSTFTLSIEVGIIVAAIVLMLYVILKTNQILTVLQGSKVEPVWRQSRVLFILLAIFFFFFSLVRMIATIDKSGDGSASILPQWLYDLGIGSTHNFMMNSSFLLTSIVLFILIRVDLKAYTALFDLIKDEQ